ncbi:hypothetical protein KBC03_07735 [Patescibacteria group bacterium]|nr:hypothetical protein [Patescibacteria group bacterium]
MCVQSVIPAYAINWEPYYQEMQTAGTPTADQGAILSSTNQEDSLLERLLSTFNINYAGNDKALKYVQIVVNYVIALVAFIALVVIMYGFYMMFFRDQDKGFASAKKTVIGAAIALFVIGISWLFVNFAFYIFNK